MCVCVCADMVCANGGRCFSLVRPKESENDRHKQHVGGARVDFRNGGGRRNRMCYRPIRPINSPTPPWVVALWRAVFTLFALSFYSQRTKVSNRNSRSFGFQMPKQRRFRKKIPFPHPVPIRTGAKLCSPRTYTTALPPLWRRITQEEGAVGV